MCIYTNINVFVHVHSINIYTHKNTYFQGSLFNETVPKSRKTLTATSILPDLGF